MIFGPSLGHHRLRCEKLRRSVFLRALEIQKRLNLFLEATPAARLKLAEGSLLGVLLKPVQGSLFDPYNTTQWLAFLAGVPSLEVKQ